MTRMRRTALSSVLALCTLASVGTIASPPAVAAAAANISLHPRFGPPGSSIRVSGTGFGPNETVNITVGEALIGSGHTDPSGAFLARATIPTSAGPGVNAVVASGTTSGITANAAFRVTTVWNQFGFSPAHASLNPFEHTLGPSNVGSLTVDWMGPNDANPICCSSPIVVRDTVYVGTGDNRLRAYRSSDGAVLWNANVGGGQVSTPAWSNGVVYVGSGDWTLYAFDAATGASRWSHKTGGPVVGGPVVSRNRVYVGSDDGNVYAFNAATGEVAWTTFVGGEINHSPAIAGDTLYVGNYTGSFLLTAMDVRTGAVRWNVPTGGYLDWNTPAVADGVVYVTSVDGEAYAFDAVSGDQIWQRTFPAFIEAAPAVAGGMVYLGTYDHSFYALDAATGARKWKATTGNLIAGTAAVANGVVYVGSTDNHVYGFDALTGAKLWDASMGGPVQFAQPVVSDGKVYVASDRLYRFGL